MRPKNYLIKGQLWAFGHPCCWETFAKSVIWCSPGKMRAHFAGSEVLKSPPLMFNSFQSMDLIVLDASSLLADDHRNLLQVFIFWNSPPVPMRMASQPFHPSCLTALALFLSLKAEKEIMLCFLLEFVPQNVLVTSHQSAQPRACWLPASWGSVSQDCLEHDPELFCGALSLNGQT